MQADNDTRAKRPTISLLSLFTFFFGLLLGFAACLWLFQLSLKDFPKIGHGGDAGICASNLKEIGLALESYHRVHGVYPANQHQLTPQYLDALPLCPAVDHMTYRTTFYNDHEALVECCGDNHSWALIAPNFPALSTREGLKIGYQR